MPNILEHKGAVIMIPLSALKGTAQDISSFGSSYKDDIKPDPEDVVFPIPQGFQPPVGIKPKEKFSAIATLYVTEDGKLCLEDLDGKAVEPEMEPEEIQNDNVVLQTLRQRLPPSGLPAD